jgi:DNA-binding NtrC family response regulator
MPDDIGTVLVVDDDVEMRALIQDVLQDHGHRVSVAADGREALKQLSEADYAVVLTDLRMKEMQGIELLSEIKHTYPDKNVILMTAFGTVDTAIERAV